jgi:hypothetical protein
LEDVGQFGDRAFHREDAVRPNHPSLGSFGLGKLGAEVVHVAVLVDGRRAFCDRLGEPHRVDDRRVIECVGDDEVPLLRDRRGEAFVGIPRRHEAERSLAADELRQPLLELAMDREGSADEPHARRPRAELVQAVDARLHDTRFIGQAEVIVGREDEHIAPSFHLHPRGLWRVEMIEALVDLVGL